ncbi:Uncharacterised protein [Dermacoccus nishinomiyaensis]|nr:Uncharacterised protein [Dermacoccus nishinomiyaensis]
MLVAGGAEVHEHVRCRCHIGSHPQGQPDGKLEVLDAVWRQGCVEAPGREEDIAAERALPLITALPKLPRTTHSGFNIGASGSKGSRISRLSPATTSWASNPSWAAWTHPSATWSSQSQNARNRARLSWAPLLRAAPAPFFAEASMTRRGTGKFRAIPSTTSRVSSVEPLSATMTSQRMRERWARSASNCCRMTCAPLSTQMMTLRSGPGSVGCVSIIRTPTSAPVLRRDAAACARPACGDAPALATRRRTKGGP